MKRNALAAGAAALSLLLAACGSSTDTTATTTPSTSSSSSSSSSSDASASGEIEIENFAYTGTMKVKAGEKVTVKNKDKQPHTVTDKVNKAFDSAKIEGGGEGTFTAPTKAGTYPFGCTIHANMKGTLVVS